MRERVDALLEDVPLDSAPNLSHVSLVLRPHVAARRRPAGARSPGLHPPLQHLRRRRSAGDHQGGLPRRWGSRKRSSCSTARRFPRISHAKNTKVTPQDLYKNAVNKESEAIAALFEQYEKALRNANALDFDDLLLEAVRLLQHDDATREAYNRRLSYVMIDEYQDTNRTQYDLMRLLTEQHRQRLRGGR